MCNLSYAIEEKGIEKGREQGVELMGKLISALSADARFDDIAKVATDKDYRNKLLKEFNLL